MRATRRATASQSRIKAADSSATKTRIRTRMHRHKLDAELAAGSDPNVDPLRRERARELLREGTRHEIADNLERVLSEADTPPRSRFSCVVPMARGAIRDSRAEIETIVERLKAPSPVSPQGVAKSMLLLTEANSPLYAYGWEQSEPPLKGVLGATVNAIDDGPGLVEIPFSAAS